jgi:hypothetical protein
MNDVENSSEITNKRFLVGDSSLPDPMSLDKIAAVDVVREPIVQFKKLRTYFNVTLSTGRLFPLEGKVRAGCW